MFTRFTVPARQVVLAATEAAGRLGAARVAPEHLLVALAEGGGDVGGRVLAAYGVTADGLCVAITDRTRRAGLTDDEVTALRSVGIDADEVFRRIEESFGAEALQPMVPSTKASRRFTPGAKKVLERSLREALALRHNYIGTEHILLGVLAEGSASDLLAAHGITYAGAQERVLDELRRAA
jgi:ATP-dependent Clp protease ATP-binding subunit ClpA